MEIRYYLKYKRILVKIKSNYLNNNCITNCNRQIATKLHCINYVSSISLFTIILTKQTFIKMKSLWVHWRGMLTKNYNNLFIWTRYIYIYSLKMSLTPHKVTSLNFICKFLSAWATDIVNWQWLSKWSVFLLFSLCELRHFNIKLFKIPKRY